MLHESSVPRDVRLVTRELSNIVPLAPTRRSLANLLCTCTRIILLDSMTILAGTIVAIGAPTDVVGALPA